MDQRGLLCREPCSYPWPLGSGVGKTPSRPYIFLFDQRVPKSGISPFLGSWGCEWVEVASGSVPLPFLCSSLICTGKASGVSSAPSKGLWRYSRTFLPDWLGTGSPRRHRSHSKSQMLLSIAPAFEPPGPTPPSPEVTLMSLCGLCAPQRTTGLEEGLPARLPLSLSPKVCPLPLAEASDSAPPESSI